MTERMVIIVAARCPQCEVEHLVFRRNGRAPWENYPVIVPLRRLRELALVCIVCDQPVLFTMDAVP